MPALNYQKQFAPLVESGQKRQTIRARRKHPIKRGDRLHHFTGMRTKACRRLRGNVEDYCAFTVDITIHENRIETEDHVTVPGKEIIAQADGFKDFAEMLAWFQKTHGLPFHGQLIRW